MATIQLRALLSESQLGDAHTGLTQLLALHAEHEVDLTPALLDLLHGLEEALAHALQTSRHAQEPPLEDLPLTIATRIAGEAAPPED